MNTQLIKDWFELNDLLIKWQKELGSEHKLVISLELLMDQLDEVIYGKKI